MSGIHLIRERHKAISNIQKVTRTMEMVSSARYRLFYNRWRDSQPFFDGLSQLAYLMVTAETQVDAPLLQEHDEGDLAVLVLGTDRGLCGAYSSNLIRMLEVHVKRAKRLGKKLRVFVNGRKTLSQIRARKIPVEKEFTEFDDVPSSNEQSDKIADEFIKKFCEKEFCSVDVIYARFYSSASQRTQTLTLMPLYDLLDDLCTRTYAIWPWEATFEDFDVSPSPEDLFPEIAKMMVRSALSECFIDAAASENLTRVNAMKNATVNADEMLTSLASDYNKARQGQITNELMDIVGGVEALN